MTIKLTFRLFTLRGCYLVEVKYCDHARPEHQLARATEQQITLKMPLHSNATKWASIPSWLER